MTKKDFELIASVMANCNKQFKLDWEIVASRFISNSLADTLASKYPRFDKEKFLKACGIDIDKQMF